MIFCHFYTEISKFGQIVRNTSEIILGENEREEEARKYFGEIGGLRKCLGKFPHDACWRPSTAYHAIQHIKRGTLQVISILYLMILSFFSALKWHHIIILFVKMPEQETKCWKLWYFLSCSKVLKEKWIFYTLWKYQGYWRSQK